MSHVKRLTGGLLARLEAEFEERQHEYLRDHGWVYSSMNPACIWLWRKEHDGEPLMGNTPTAIALERAISGDEEEPPGVKPAGQRCPQCQGSGRSRARCQLGNLPEGFPPECEFGRITE